jgi:alpha-D-ribose 1-methylphosphonate 5-triphosphate diphosphatase
MKDLLIGNARLVMAGEIINGSLRIRDGMIEQIDSGATDVSDVVDLQGDLLMPGLVELHTDNFERHLMPRPKVRWPELPALISHDAEVVAAGITTVYDALGVGDADPDAMRGQDMQPVVDAIRAAQRHGMLRAEHRLHIRCELPAPNALSLFAPFQEAGMVGMISLMDHTPGQRQWENIEQARVYYTGKKGWSNEKFERSVADSVELQEKYALPHRRFFTEYAKQHSVMLASHDDTQLHHVEEAARDGVTICEFPTRIEAARAARERGMVNVMGAPNVVRGGSHSGNVSALDLARLDLLDTLSSDYIPASLLMAAFKLVSHAGFSLPKAVATISRNPARAAGLNDRGEILAGLRGDLIQVNADHDQPVVRAVWRSGVRVM